MTWLVYLLTGALIVALLWALTDRDILYKISGRIKIKGRGHQVNDLLDVDLENLPPGIKKRHSLFHSYFWLVGSPCHELIGTSFLEL